MHRPRAYIFHFKYCIHASIVTIPILSLSRVSYLKTPDMQCFRRWHSSQRAATPAQPQSHNPLIINHGISTIDCDEESLYNYTSGRWLWREKDQVSRRYVKFNLAELVRIAIQVTGSNSCVQVQKLPEGNFSKVFLITMDDGKEVIAKLPNPKAGHQHFTTASEVATMDYVRAYFASSGLFLFV